MLIFVKLWILKKYARRLLRASIQGLSLNLAETRSAILYMIQSVRSPIILED